CSYPRPVVCVTSVFVDSSGVPRDLHSFPTRRSSDLSRREAPRSNLRSCTACCVVPSPEDSSSASASRMLRVSLPRMGGSNGAARSEEHTSELQSRENLVCRLLLEKKKTPSNTRWTP